MHSKTTFVTVNRKMLNPIRYTDINSKTTFVTVNPEIFLSSLFFTNIQKQPLLLLIAKYKD